MIYYSAWEEIYFISARDPRLIVNIFDDRGMDVTGLIDKIHNEIVILDPSNPEGAIFQGHVRIWNELTEEMKAALTQAGLVTRKGKIIK